MQVGIWVILTQLNVNAVTTAFNKETWMKQQFFFPAQLTPTHFYNSQTKKKTKLQNSQTIK